MVAYAVIPQHLGREAGEFGIQGSPQLHGDLEANLVYMRFLSLRKKKKKKSWSRKIKILPPIPRSALQTFKF